MEDLVQSLFNESTGGEGQFANTDEGTESSTIRPTTSKVWCPTCTGLAREMEEKYTKSFVAIKQKIYFTDNLIQMYQTCKKQLEENTEKLIQTNKDKNLIQSQLELLLSKEEPTFTETQSLRNEVKILKETIENLRTQLHGMDESRRIHEESIKILKAEDSGTVFDLKRKHKKEISELKDELSEKSLSNRKLKKRNKDLQETISKLRESKKRIRRSSKSISRESSVKTGRDAPNDVEMKSTDHDEAMTGVDKNRGDISTNPSEIITSPQVDSTILNDTVFEIPRRSRRISSNKDQEKVAYITSTTDDSADDIIVNNKKPQEIGEDVVSSTSIVPSLTENKKKVFKDRMMDLKRKRAYASFKRRPTQSQLSELLKFAETWKERLSNNSSLGKEKSIEYLITYLSEFCEKQLLESHEKLVLDKLYKLHKGLFSGIHQSWLQSAINSLENSKFSSEHSASDNDGRKESIDSPDCHVSSTQKIPSPVPLDNSMNSCSNFPVLNDDIVNIDKDVEITGNTFTAKLNSSAEITISLPVTTPVISKITDELLKTNSIGRPVETAVLIINDDDDEDSGAPDLNENTNAQRKHLRKSSKRRKSKKNSNGSLPIEDTLVDVESLSDEMEEESALTKIDPVEIVGPSTEPIIDDIIDLEADKMIETSKENNLQKLSCSDNTDVVEGFISEMPDIGDLNEVQTSELPNESLKFFSVPVAPPNPQTKENLQNIGMEAKTIAVVEIAGLSESKTLGTFEATENKNTSITVSTEESVPTETSSKAVTLNQEAVENMDETGVSINIVPQKTRISRVATRSNQEFFKIDEENNDDQKVSNRKRKISSTYSDKSKLRKVEKFQEPKQPPPMPSGKLRTRSMTADSSSDHEMVPVVPPSPLRRSKRIGSRNRTTSSSSESSKDGGAKEIKKETNVKTPKKGNQSKMKLFVNMRRKEKFKKMKAAQKLDLERKSDVKSVQVILSQKSVSSEIVQEESIDKIAMSVDEIQVPAIVEELTIDSPLSSSSADSGDLENIFDNDLKKWHHKVNKIVQQMSFDVQNALSPLPTTPISMQEDEDLDNENVRREQVSGNQEVNKDDVVQQVVFTEHTSSGENIPVITGIPELSKGRDSISPSTVLCTAIKFGTPSKDFNKNTTDKNSVAEKITNSPISKVSRVIRSPSSLSDDIILKSTFDQPSCSKAFLFGTGSVANDILKPRRFSCEAPERAVNVRPIKPIIKGASFDVQSPLVLTKNKDLRKTCSLPPHRREGDVPSHWHSSVSHREDKSNDSMEFSSDNPLEIQTESENEDNDLELTNINASVSSEGIIVAEDFDDCTTPKDFDAETWLNDMTSMSPLLTDIESDSDDEKLQQNQFSKLVENDSIAKYAEFIHFESSNNIVKEKDKNEKPVYGDSQERTKDTTIVFNDENQLAPSNSDDKHSKDQSDKTTDESFCTVENNNETSSSHPNYTSCDSSVEDGDLVMDFSEDDEVKVKLKSTTAVAKSKVYDNGKSGVTEKNTGDDIRSQGIEEDIIAYANGQQPENFCQDGVVGFEETNTEASSIDPTKGQSVLKLSQVENHKSAPTSSTKQHVESQNEEIINDNTADKLFTNIVMKTSSHESKLDNAAESGLHLKLEVASRIRVQVNKSMKTLDTNNVNKTDEIPSSSNPSVPLLSQNPRLGTDVENTNVTSSSSENQTQPTLDLSEDTELQIDEGNTSGMTNEAMEIDDHIGEKPDIPEIKRKRTQPENQTSDLPYTNATSVPVGTFTTSAYEQWISQSLKVEGQFVINSVKDINTLVSNHLQNRNTQNVKFYKHFLPRCIFKMLNKSTEKFNNIFQNHGNGDISISNLPLHESMFIKRMRLIQTTEICDGNFIRMIILPLLMKFFMYFPKMAPCNFTDATTTTGYQLLSRLKRDIMPNEIDPSVYSTHPRAHCLVRVFSYLCRISGSLSSFYALCRYCLIWQQGTLLFALMQAILCWPKALIVHPDIGKSIIRIIKRHLSSAMIVSDAEKILELNRQLRWIEDQCHWDKLQRVTQFKEFEAHLPGILEAKLSDEFEKFLSREEKGSHENIVLPISVFDENTTLAICMFELLIKESTMELVKLEVLDKLFWPILNKWSRHIHIHGDIDEGREVSNVCIVALLYTFSSILSTYMLRQRHLHKTQRTLPFFQTHFTVICGLMEQLATLYLEKAPRIVQCATASFLLRTCFVNPSGSHKSVLKWVKATMVDRSRQHKNLSLVVALSCCTEQKLKMLCQRLDSDYGTSPGESIVSHLWLR